jgi:hypothetical protein
MNKTYVDIIDGGFESLLIRFGKFQPDTEKLIGELLFKLKQKTQEEIKLEAYALAVHYQKECKFYLNRIEQMNQLEIEAFIWNILMRLDIIRGIFPGLQNEDPFGLNLQLESFENEIWVKINQYFHFKSNLT